MENKYNPRGNNSEEGLATDLASALKQAVLSVFDGPNFDGASSNKYNSRGDNSELVAGMEAPELDMPDIGTKSGAETNKYNPRGESKGLTSGMSIPSGEEVLAALKGLGAGPDSAVAEDSAPMPRRKPQEGSGEASSSVPTPRSKPEEEGPQEAPKRANAPARWSDNDIMARTLTDTIEDRARSGDQTALSFLESIMEEVKEKMQNVERGSSDPSAGGRFGNRNN